jgi:AcrR family transcriptional regulator
MTRETTADAPGPITRETTAVTHDPVDGPPPRDRSRRRRRDGDDREPAGRGQILDAAIASILELGFYRASSNEIARRANMSWGSIQYHFGSREALLLAVIEELNRRFTVSVNRARISGETLEDRLRSLYDILATQYADPVYLARLQIILNLSHDPGTSAGVVSSLARQAEIAGQDLSRLFRETLGDQVSKATTTAIFHAMRGWALSRQIADATPWPAASTHRPATGRHELATFLAGLAAMAELDPGTVR